MKHKLFFIFLAFSTIGFTQKKEQIRIHKFTQKDGINSYNILRIFQDKFNFLWVASQDGLSRYDGKNFVSYAMDALTNHKLCGGPDIRDLLLDTLKNELWVLPGNVGINVINTITGNVVKTIPIPYTNNEDWNICMVKNNKYLWIGTFSGIKLYNINKNAFELLPPIKGDSSNGVEFEVRAIMKDINGNIWVCYSGYGIVVYNGKSKKIIKNIPLTSLNDYLKSGNIKFLKCLETKYGEIIFATTQGLRKINYDQQYNIKIDNSPCKLFPQLNVENVAYLSKQNNGNILVAGCGKVFNFNAELNNYTELKELPGIGESNWINAIQCMYLDHEENIWLGCEEGLGFISHKKTPFQPYSYDANTNTKLDHVRSILPLDNGDVLAGLRNGIIHINHLSNTYTKRDVLHVYSHVFKNKNGAIIVSRSDGLFIYNINGEMMPITKKYPEFFPYATVTINSHLIINDSLIVLGTESSDGILLWNPLTKKVRQLKKENGINSISSNIVNNLYHDSKENIYVLSDNVISLLSKNFEQVKEITLKNQKTNQPYNLFFDMCEVKHDYFIAAYGWGILQVDASFNIKKVFNAADGLSNDGVYQVYNLNDKSILITSNNGLSVLDLNTNKIKNYFVNDGLHSNGFEEVCGLKYGDYIYAGGLNGFTKINPLLFSTDTIPPVFYFTNIKTQLPGKTIDTGNLFIKSITIPSNWLQTNVSFIGINYAKPESIRYRYRIEEKDTTWVNLGTQNFVNFIGFGPGTYTIEAQASNDDGYWSKPKEIKLIFLPKWYQTWLFKLLVFMMVTGILYALYKYRINQIKQQQKIRHNIASDLHDDVGSLLNSAKVFNNLAKMQPNQNEYFMHVDESLTEASVSLRDMIWILDNAADTIDDLMDRVNKFAIPITNASSIQFKYKINLSEKNQRITKTEKRNLFLMLKEAINNSIKYADCNNITIDFYEHKKGIILNILDDGNGFDMEQKTYGNGLRNIAERAKQINCTCKIISSLGNGTRIIIAKK